MQPRHQRHSLRPIQKGLFCFCLFNCLFLDSLEPSACACAPEGSARTKGRRLKGKSRRADKARRKTIALALFRAVANFSLFTFHFSLFTLHFSSSSPSHLQYISNTSLIHLQFFSSFSLVSIIRDILEENRRKTGEKLEENFRKTRGNLDHLYSVSDLNKNQEKHLCLTA